jgi:4-hydroxybenzoate polyprenyltransferase
MFKLPSQFFKYRAVFRVNDWKDSHLLFTLLGSLIWTFNQKVSFQHFFIPFLYLFSTSILLAAFGFYLNDCFDIESDRIAKKKNFASEHKPFIRFLLLVILFLLIFISWLLMNRNSLFLSVIFIEIGLLLSYSIPIIRLKERPILSIFIDTLYAYVVPGFFVILLFIDNIQLNALLLFYFLWLFLIGIKGIISHQLDDFYNDKLSNTKTFAVHFGIFRTTRFLKFFIYPTELLVFLIFITLLFKPLLLIYFGFWILNIKIGDLFPIHDRVRYLKTEANVLFKVTFGFYTIWLPIVFITLLSFLEIKFLILYPLFIILFYIQFKSHLKSLTKFFKPLYYYLFGISSFIVNHSLYYFFLIFGIDLKERAEAKLVKVDSIEILRTDKVDLVNNRGLVLDKIIEKKVNSLWIGNKLSNMELLTIRSFIENGYEFYLWTYGKLKNELPDSVIICNANEIIPYNEVFVYKSKSQFGNGQGSVAGFSDIFRYKLLYEKGGWWVDMDVTCLRPFDVVSDYFFRYHHELGIVGNVMKTPKNSPLMKLCYEQAKSTINENNSNWYKPIQLLVNNINQLQLNDFVFNGLSNTDEFQKIEKYYFESSEFPEEWCFIHWCNEVLRSYSLSKENSFFYSNYTQLLLKYKLIETPTNIDKFDRDFKKKLFFANLKKII